MKKIKEKIYKLYKHYGRKIPLLNDLENEYLTDEFNDKVLAIKETRCKK